jgi:hypothetical protein
LFCEKEKEVETHFAPAERSNDDELTKEIEMVSKNPVMDGLLHSVSGLLAILNEHRQVIAVNPWLLEMLEVDCTEKVLGLRPGEALECVYSHEMPGGCGTSRRCSTCGAAISIVMSLTTNMPVERECALAVEKDGKNRDLFFRVRSVPITYNTKRFLLFFLQDITYQQRLAALERVFFHDVNGILSGLIGASELISLRADEDTRGLLQTIQRLAFRLANEVSMQRCLSQSDSYVFQPTTSSISVSQICKEIQDIFYSNPVSRNRLLVLQKEIPDVSLRTEPSLLIRVLSNMITNAFEESQDGDEVRVWIESLPGRVTFCVWNRKPIPSDIAKRIFQRNFSTKAEIGRGLGTYSMKLFGEEILGGTVDFVTSEAEGTVFRFSLKIHTDSSDILISSEERGGGSTRESSIHRT